MLGLGSPEVAPQRGGEELSLAELLGDYGDNALPPPAPLSWATPRPGAASAAAPPAPVPFEAFAFGGGASGGAGGAGASRGAPSLEDSPWASPEGVAAVRLPARPRVACFLEDEDDGAPPLPRVPLGQPVAQAASAQTHFKAPERLGALRPANGPGGGLPTRLPAAQPPGSFYGPRGGGDAGGASSSAAATARAGGNAALAALLEKKSGAADAGRPLRRERSDASLPASDGGRKGPPARKRLKKAMLDSSDDSDEEEEAATDSDGDTPAPKARPAAKSGGDADVAGGEDGEEAAEEASEEEGASDSGGDSSGDEEELYGDTLEECGRIAAGLRSALGAAGTGNRVAATDAGGAEALRLVSAAQVRAACVDGAPKAKAAACPELKGYQLVGVNFLLLLHTQGVEGAILADEMGLGKTAQAISFLAAVNARRLSEGHPPQPHMVIAPASVLENWARELDRWAPALKVVTYHGSERSTVRDDIDREMRAAEAAGDEDPSPPFDVILCCYTMFERDTADQQEDRRWLKTFRFGYAVLDEAHLVKNRAAQRARRLRNVLGRAAAHRLMLTGTPLQNDLGELLALLELLMPSLFDGRGALLDDAELKRAGRGGDASARTIARVRHLMGPFVLRRLKREVLQQLTPKVQVTQAIAATASQQALYSAALSAVRAEVAAKAAARAGGAGADVERVVGAARLKALFTYLRKVANHPLLVRQRYSDDDVAEVSRLCALRGVFGADAPPKKVREHVESLSDFALHALCSDSRLGGALLHKRLPSDAALDSGKARFLAELLPALAAKGSRPLIFSQWKIMLDVLEWTLAELGLKFFRLDGSTPVEERQALVDAYNAPDSTCFAFLLSTRAGGQGINLTGADTVILHDCDFNPQIDRQAEDRSHRLGQTRPVTVYRLVTQDTVDAKIVAIAERKLTLDAAVLSANDDEAGAPAEEGMVDAKASRQAEARSMAALLQGLLAEGAASEAQAASAQAGPAVVIRDMKDD